MAVTAAQRAQLLRAINPKRVGSDGKGHSHVEAYEIRAHLNRLFDFTGWSAETISMECIFEDKTEPTKPGEKARYTVAYRAQLRLIVDCAVYTEWAVGDAANQPSRADAHDLALKTAESQALKRAAANLGDQFGLSLYGKGSKDALVRAVIGTEPTVAATAVDAHITEQVVPERAAEPAEVKPDPRSTSTATPLRPVVSDTIASLRAKQEAIQARGPRGR